MIGYNERERATTDWKRRNISTRSPSPRKQVFWIPQTDSASTPKRRQRCTPNRRSTSNSFVDYSQRSMIHGVSYLGEQNLHWTERLWWFISIAISIVLCTIMIYKIYSQWLNAPAIISFSNEATPVSEFPFPAITICNENELKVSDAPSFNDMHGEFFMQGVDNDIGDIDIENYSDTVASFIRINISVENIQRAYALSNICQPLSDNFGDYVKFHGIQLKRNAWPYIESSVYDLFEDSLYCRLDIDAKSSVGCNELFTKTLTDIGVCYTFNHLATKEIFYEHKLADDFPKVKLFQTEVYDYDTDSRHNLTYPYRLQASGVGLMVSITLQIRENERFQKQNCKSSGVEMFPMKGLKVHIHLADDVPQMKNKFHQISYDNLVHFTVIPNTIVTDDNLINNYDKLKRKCVAEHENELVFFKKYTQSNCHLEIFVMQAIKVCGCARFWMPRFNDTKICASWDEVKCVERLDANANVTTLKNDKCLPACNSTTYGVEVSMSRLEGHPNRDDLKDMGFIVSFDDNQYISLRRSELYTSVDLIAACGGILGLFMGISFLSIVEIVYSATLRAYFDLSRRSPKKNSEQSEQNDNEDTTIESFD